MIGKTYTYARMGMSCSLIEVEIDIKNGLPIVLISGLLSQEVKESRERIRPAIINSGFDFPIKRLTINLSPAELTKTGTHYDLAIASAILKAIGDLNENGLKTAYFGELNLSGETKWIRGALPMVVEAQNQRFDRIVIPKANYHEVNFLGNKNIIPVENLCDLIEKINNPENFCDFSHEVKEETIIYGDYTDLMGQSYMIDGFEIAAAGNHHILLIGPPGSGKTMGASRLPSIMPDLEDDDILEINKIYSIACEEPHTGWITTRPFRSPHNSSSGRALIGGGLKILPGEISLAHKGILFLDEFLEFRNDSLQALRTVLDKKEVYISLRNGYALYPADFLLTAAANPCQCGHYETKDGFCSCNLAEVKKYRKKLRNPLTDRIDLQIKVDRINYKNLTSSEKNRNSIEIKENVLLTRLIQKNRFSKEKFKLNSQIPPEKISFYCLLEKEADVFLEQFIEEHLLTARACHKILRIARTITDLKSKDLIGIEEIKKALKYRFLDLEN